MAFPRLIWKIESTPTPYTVAVWPYFTVRGRTLSISSGAETRRVACPGSAALSKFAAAARISVVPDLIPTMWPWPSTVATVLSLLVHTNATLGIATESPGPRTCHAVAVATVSLPRIRILRSEEHTSELQSRLHLVCRLLLEKK